MLIFHNIETKIVICSLSRNGGIPFLFFCQIEEVLESCRDFDKFFRSVWCWKYWRFRESWSNYILFVFCQIDELLLAKLGYLLLACNQSFSTFPIWFWDISDLYIFDDLVLTWWIVFIVMEALPCPYLKYLMIIFFEVFGLLGPFLNA